MLVSELIKKLYEIRDRHGDHEVVFDSTGEPVRVVRSVLEPIEAKPRPPVAKTGRLEPTEGQRQANGRATIDIPDLTRTNRRFRASRRL
jgi:hypothetical protein